MVFVRSASHGQPVYASDRAMTRDPTLYPDPEEFVPERFLTEDGICNNEDMVFTFGFGQYLCLEYQL